MAGRVKRHGRVSLWVKDCSFQVPHGIFHTVNFSVEGYAAAIDSRDSFIIKALWIGVRNALNAHNLCSKEIEQMEETLKMYLVTK